MDWKFVVTLCVAVLGILVAICGSRDLRLWCSERIKEGRRLLKVSASWATMSGTTLTAWALRRINGLRTLEIIGTIAILGIIIYAINVFPNWWRKGVDAAENIRKEVQEKSDKQELARRFSIECSGDCTNLEFHLDVCEGSALDVAVRGMRRRSLPNLKRGNEHLKVCLVAKGFGVKKCESLEHPCIELSVSSTRDKSRMGIEKHNGGWENNTN